MTQQELNDVVRKHKLWLESKEGGERAYMWKADLQATYMRGVNLQDANLQDANMRNADMKSTNLRNANMQRADMRGANIDYSAWPLWCGSLKAHVDDQIAIQLLYHTLSVVQNSPYVSEELKRVLLTEPVVDIANRFHRVDECGKLEAYKEEE